MYKRQDGADAKVQKEAGVPGADLVVACASTDELNMLSCLLAKRLGAKHTIARVRNPIYYQQIDLLKEDLRLSMAVNPELMAAFEISRSILLPDTAKVETFMKGKVGYYLAKQLLGLGMQVKIIEQDWKKCEDLCDQLPKATIICGNAADHDLLIEEGIEQADALVSLTGMDEENIILALFAKTKGVDKIVAKVNEDGRAQLVEELGIDLIVSAKTATADAIMSYVRARQNSLKNVNVESMYQLVGGRVEALEFIIKEKTEYTDIPFKDLELKPNNLIACIGRKRQIIIPDGDESIQVGDSVVIVTTQKKVKDITDILAEQ